MIVRLIVNKRDCNSLFSISNKSNNRGLPMPFKMGERLLT
jgi:hypothetical protein